MKLFFTFLATVAFGAVTIDHQRASELLKREPRANEGLSEVIFRSDTSYSMNHTVCNIPYDTYDM